MSQCRIIIKNLPPKTTEETLRQRFGRHGLITDCRLMKTPKGLSRRFAFMGFQTESMAHQSLKENSAYLGKYKLEVSYALPQNNCEEIKPWSKYNTKSTAFKKTMERKELLRAQRKEKLKKSFTEMVGGAGRKELKAEEALEVNSEEVATDTGRLYVRNLPFSTTEESLRAAFSAFGSLQDVYLPVDEVTKEPRGFAFVTFLFPDQAIKALHHFDGSVLEGRVITVKGAQEKPATHEYEEPRKLSFSGERERELRKKADIMEHTWNLLYVSSDAALNVQAQAMDVDKSDLLDLDESGVAVRTALAETKLIQETKDWLKREGIPCEPEVFENSFFQTTKKRSDTCLILKNLPAETEYASLVDLIDKAVGDRKSSISRVCLAPSRTCCILQCEDARSAKHIFGKLAFRRYHHKPLYLEYAPVEVYVKTEDSDKPQESPKPAKEPLVATVFAKNLNFKTTEAGLTGAFKSFAGFKRATLMTKPKKQFNEDLQQMQIVKISAGYAFIEFRTHKDAGECVKCMQHKVLDDHRLELEISHAGKDDSLKTLLRQKKAQAAEEICSAKLCVRNLAFQATQKDLVDLFAQFGQVVSCRIPMKIGNTQHRGFGFITLATQVEAREATEALRNTHLYGRHLIIENAREEEDDQTTEMVEERTTKYITGNKVNKSTRKRKLDGI